MTGNKPPGLVPNKFMYMRKDLTRLSEYFGVPMQSPADPFEAMFQKGTHIQTGSWEFSHAQDCGEQLSGLLLFSSPRLLVCHAICGSSTREGEGWRQAGGAGVPGAVEKDLE